MLLLILKSSACLAVFMLFYKVFLEKESIHQFKRFYLLGALLVSIIIPFITFTQYIEVEPIQDFVPFQPLEFSTTESFIPEVKTWQDYMPTVLWSIYFIGVALFSFRFALNLRAIYYRIKTNPKHQYHEFTNVLMQDLIHPHTFFKYIFLNKRKYEHNLIPNEVLLHEQTHAKQKHAFDILCIEVLQIIFWFNPLLYFIKKDIKLNHEFLADQAVLQKGIDATQYKQTLLAFSSNANETPLANAINYSLIKKRFNVMKSKTSKQAFWLRSLLLLPVLALLIYSFSEKEIVEREVASIEPIAIQQVKTDKGATEAMMNEYKVFIKELEKSNSINYPKLQRVIAIYDLMTEAQRKTVKMYPKTFFPSSLSKVKPKTPSATQLNSWKNKKEFAVWIDGKVINNSQLNNYSASDFKYYTSSFVYNNARSERFPQPYQNHLYTKKGFEETYTKSGVKKYNHLKSKYLNSKKDKSLNGDELRLLKTQVERAYKVLTKEEVEKYDVRKLSSSKVNTNDNVIVTRNQVIEYNKLKHHSSEEFHYTNQTFWVKNSKGERIAKKYYACSEKQKKEWLLFPPTIYTKKQISKEEFEKLFDTSNYVVRLDGVLINNLDLKKRKNTDFVSFSSDNISELAELPQKYHYNLFTENGHRMNLYTRKFSDNYKPKPADIKNEENIAKATQAGNYPLEFYFRKIDDAIIVSIRKKQMVEAVKKDKFKSYLQDLIKETALKPEKFVVIINIEKSTEKSRVSFVENTLRSLNILKINKRDYTAPKLNPNYPPPPHVNKSNKKGPQVGDIINTTQQKATPKQIAEYNTLAKKFSKNPNGIIKSKDVNRLKYLYSLLSKEQKEKYAEPFPKFAPPPPPPAMDTISTYNSLATRTKFIPKNRANNIKHLKVLFNKMSSSQKGKVENPNSINKYIAQLDNLSAKQIEKVNDLYNKIKTKAESKGRKFYTTAEYKELEELYASMLSGNK